MALLALVWRGAAQQQALREAARLDREGRCEEAQKYYRQALAQGSPSPALLNNLGNHYLICGQPQKARSYFEQLIKINPAHANANLQLARIATDQRQGSKALEYLARVKESGPAVRLLRAEASYWAGRHEAALSILNALEKEAGGDPPVLFSLGTVYARIGRYDRAESAFQAVLVKQPGNFDVLFNLGRAAARAAHYDRAQSALEVALKLRPGDADTLLELGLVHAARQDSSRAVYYLAQARQRSPKRADILLALARAAEDAGFYGDSALAYDEYLALRPDDDKVRRDRGRVYGYSGTRLEEGLKEMAWYIEKHPEDPIGHYNLAQFTWRSEPEKSLEQLEKALRLDPGFAPARVSLAWLLHRMGRSAEAAPHLQAALKVMPDNVRALDLLGLAYLSLGRAAEAEKVLRRAEALAPDDPEVLLHLGRALMALDRADEAQRFLGRYRQVRPRRYRDPRKEPGMIELATLSEPERRKREIERFRRMSASRPDDAKLQLHLASLLLADGKEDEALGEFRKLLAMNADSETWEEAGRVLLRAEQYAAAGEFLERAAVERPRARLDLAIARFFSEGAAAALRAIEGVAEAERGGDYYLMKAGILDAAGRIEEAQQVLWQGLSHSSTRPEVIRQAVALLVRWERKTEALELVNRGIETAPDSADLHLVKAIVLGLLNRDEEGEETIRQIQSRWPEWDRPYLVQGLLLERKGRPGDARQKVQTAIALGAQDPAARCALARLKGAAAPDSKCDCVRGLYELLFPACSVP